ncbi:MAG: hypothetical protein C0606_05415 [Hyphomicrobiales bacterium]|nr:MAG: hypothetical protein C0606_05415 [Hyphomicrobiales bacterium]
MSIGIIGVVVDGTKSIAANALVLTPLGEAWYALSPETLNLSQAAVERHVHPFLWDPIIQSVLLLPNWAVIGSLGFLLVLLTTPRRREVKHITV